MVSLIGSESVCWELCHSLCYHTTSKHPPLPFFSLACVDKLIELVECVELPSSRKSQHYVWQLTHQCGSELATLCVLKKLIKADLGRHLPVVYHHRTLPQLATTTVWTQTCLFWGRTRKSLSMWFEARWMIEVPWTKIEFLILKLVCVSYGFIKKSFSFQWQLSNWLVSNALNMSSVV